MFSNFIDDIYIYTFNKYKFYMQKIIKFTAFSTVLLSFIYAQDSNEESNNTKIKEISKKYLLNEVVTTGKNDQDLEKINQYQSGSNIDSRALESNPNGNGDITSILRILPNVQYDRTQLRSSTPGEVDPANISISGGTYYQNLFTIDGMNMNNDINPAGSAGAYGGETEGRSQGMAIDTSLLESITVQDSNVGASYGGFTGGVIEAKTKRPTKKFGAKVSYQITQGNAAPGSASMTNYHIYGTDAAFQNFLNSYSASSQPNFQKHFIRASAESKITDNFGVIASFNTTQSFIPLKVSTGSNPAYATPIDPPDDQTAKQDEKRQIYNAFIKAHYDISDSLRTELSYTYAPQYNTHFFWGSRDDFYSIDSGGHQVGFKSFWENKLGMLTNTLSYSYLQNSVSTYGYIDHKFWAISQNRNGTNWNGIIREGGYAPYNSMQHTVSNKIIQDFSSMELGPTTHTFQVGAEIGYQFVSNANPRDYYASSNTPRFMTQAEQALCAQTDMQWCDTAVAYWPRGRPSDYTNMELTNGTVTNLNGVGGYSWNYGQYIAGTQYLREGEISLHNGLFALFIEDNIKIPLSKFGEFNMRPGIRIDSDTYMGKITPAYRLSLNYNFPWNKWENGKDFPTQITVGINRYYGRNIFAYALADGMAALRQSLRRNAPNVSWESIWESGKICANAQDSNCISTQNRSSTKFSQLNVPFTDEYMVGVAQNVYDWNFGVKYIFRYGQDDIRRSRANTLGLGADANYASNYYVYTNEGKSYTNVVTASIQNNIPVEFLGIKNYFLFAFDWTNVRRNYQDYTDTLVLDDLQDNYISYNGEILRYSERPIENFIRPYTIRLNTTHTFNVWKTKWLLNNFFRFRSAYYASAATGQQVNATLPNGNTVLADEYRVILIPNSFTWDIRIGFEIDMVKGNTLFVNLDIFNLLDTQNTAITSFRGSTGAITSVTYEVGRQFWLELGYKF